MSRELVPLQHFTHESIPLQVEELQGLFAYGHLPAHLQEVSKPFGELAEKLVASKLWTFQTVDALSHLLRAKDAAVRAYKQETDFFLRERERAAGLARG